MSVELLVGVVLIVALVVVMTSAGGAAETIGGLFSHPTQLGWPRGVQEDDDMSWAWPAAADTAAHDHDPPDGGAWRVPTQPIRHSERPTRYAGRSARARS